jgi:hypothetical protein
VTEFRAWALSLLGPRGGRQGFSTRHPKESHRAATVVHGTLVCFIKIGVLKSLDLASLMTARGSTKQHLLKTMSPIQGIHFDLIAHCKGCAAHST